MKRVLFASLVLFIVLLTYAVVFAQGKGKGGGGGQQQKSERVERNEKQAKSEAQEPSEGAREDKGQGREQRDRRRGRELPTAEEKEQQKQKQKQQQERAAQAKEKSQEAEKLTAGGKEHQQQLKALDEQLAHEQAKHADRVARLERLRQLAEQQNNTKTVERVGKLMEKEQQQYDRRLKNLEEKRTKILQLAEGPAGKDVQAAVTETEGKAEEKSKAKTPAEETGEQKQETGAKE